MPLTIRMAFEQGMSLFMYNMQGQCWHRCLSRETPGHLPSTMGNDAFPSKENGSSMRSRVASTVGPG